VRYQRQPRSALASGHHFGHRPFTGVTTFRFGDFEWDEAKARANVRKHGVSFGEAATCFLDPDAFTAPDKEYPERFILIGLSHQLRVLFVVSAEAGERVRIISARKASRAQRKVYEDGP
jgi:uncharacterized DUF497 family protein